MIATTIEQSKELVRLGLDPKTADMYYTGHRSIHNPKEIEYTEEPRVRTKFVSFDRLEVFFPAWSLSALLELMPKVIVHDMNKHVLCLKYAEGVAPFMYYVVESGRNKGKLIRFGNGRCTPDAYDALDAAYEMVCWLLEQGLIKKGGNDETE